MVLQAHNQVTGLVALRLKSLEDLVGAARCIDACCSANKDFLADFVSVIGHGKCVCRIEPGQAADSFGRCLLLGDHASRSLSVTFQPEQRG
jgi:hypothetical protein